MLSTILSNHGILEYVITTPEELQEWLIATPDLSSFEYLMYSFPVSEQAKFFIIRDVAQWYGLLCQKIANNEDIEVSFLGVDTTQRKKVLKQYLALFMKDLVGMDLFDVDLQSLTTSLLDRSQEALTRLLVLLVAEGVLSELTLFKFNIELASVPRWQSIGLEAIPEIEELEQYFI